MAHTFVVGSRWRPVVRCKAETAAGDGLGPRTLTDPTTLTLKVRDPAGTETAYTYGAAQITRRSLGVFYREIDLTSAGKWVVRYIATGAVVDAIEHYIEVPQSFLQAP